eukprot:9491587-Pyramimonas_sp.AAC.1
MSGAVLLACGMFVGLAVGMLIGRCVCAKSAVVPPASPTVAPEPPIPSAPAGARLALPVHLARRSEVYHSDKMCPALCRSPTVDVIRACKLCYGRNACAKAD